MNDSLVPSRVLVVDDCRDTTSSLRLLLSFWGHETWAAEDGPTALLLASVYRPDVVLLDISMPHMDGFELARRLRQLPHLQHGLLVALTGHSHDTFRQRAREAGCDAYLVKPVEPEALEQLLATRSAGGRTFSSQT
jgi:CheY-like chemotaxis protein